MNILFYLASVKLEISNDDGIFFEKSNAIFKNHTIILII